MAIAERMPDVGRRYYERVLEEIDQPARGLSRGASRPPATLRLATVPSPPAQYMELCKASLFLAAHLPGAAPAPSDERIAEVIDSATRMFLAAYKAK